MQLAVIELARNKARMPGANSSEINPSTPYPVIDLLPEQRNIEDKGATMRLGGHDVIIKKGTKAFDLFGEKTRLRFRHRYEVNPDFIEKIENSGVVFSGRAPQKEIMQILELPDHPFFMATQAHPELTSRLEKPNPLFLEFVKASSRFPK
jgi:CTP synthase